MSPTPMDAFAAIHLQRSVFRAKISVTTLSEVVPVPTIAEKAAVVKQKVSEGEAEGAVIGKVARACAKNPTAAAFNIWHANGDIGIGSDKEWGKQA